MLIHFEDLKEEPLAPFYIPAVSSILERRPRIIKHGNTFALFDHYGDISGERGSPEGIFHEDTRFLSAFSLTINGYRPLLLSSNVQDNAVLSVDLTNPDFGREGQITVPRDTLHLLRSKFLWDGACYERIGIHNYDLHSHLVDIGLNFMCDFADLFEVRGTARERRGKMRIDVGQAHARFIYAGLDGIIRATSFFFDPPPSVLDRASARFRLEIKPRQRLSLFVTVRCRKQDEIGSGAQRFSAALRSSRVRMQTSRKYMARVETSHEVFNEVMMRSSEDLAMLITSTDEGPYPYAGIPWYSAPFGRDALITAIQTLWANPQLAAGVLAFLAKRQATELNPEADAEPGKILHEMRQGEMANLGEVPFGLYYGSVDSTPLFVMLAGMYHERTGDDATIRHLWPHIEAALGWMDNYGDGDGDGFIEYGQHESPGLHNQGWKDSHDAVFHADGSMAARPIALCEVQGYAYAAKRHAARLAGILGMHDMALELEKKAAALKAHFHEAFWCEDIGTYALALDGSKTPCRVRTSNAGQLLFTGILYEAYAEKITAQLLSDVFFTGWGIRTVAASEARYNPMSYHNGSIWPHDNSLIALGMARYGLMHGAQRILSGIFDAATFMDLHRLPELFCGFSRRPDKQPTSYPVACIPQAWASGAPYCMLQACLGLHFNPKSKEIHFRRPLLPSFLDEVALYGLEVGGSRMDIRIERHDHEVAVNVLRRQGDARVVVTL